jgi:hypothetical protein
VERAAGFLLGAVFRTGRRGAAAAAGRLVEADARRVAAGLVRVFFLLVDAALACGLAGLTAFRGVAARFRPAAFDVFVALEAAVLAAAGRRAGRAGAFRRVAGRAARAAWLEPAAALGRLRFGAACFERERL